MAQNTAAISATGQAIPSGAGTVRRVIVSNHSSGVIKLIDSPNSTAGRVILPDYTLPSGAQILDLEADYSEGVHFQLVSGSATISLVYEPSIIR